MNANQEVGLLFGKQLRAIHAVSSAEKEMLRSTCDLMITTQADTKVVESVLLGT